MRWFCWVCRGADITMHASNQSFYSCPFSKSVPRCTSRVSWLLAVLSVLGSAAFSGCGNSSTSGKYRVSGTVTLDGEDVTNGFVTFVPDGDRFISSDAGYISDGRFSFEAWPGPKRVEIEAIRFTDGPDDGDLEPRDWIAARDSSPVRKFRYIGKSLRSGCRPLQHPQIAREGLELLQQSSGKPAITTERDAEYDPRCAELGAVDADLEQLITLAPAGRGQCARRAPSAGPPSR
jgi:hypothetical protein